MSNSRNLPQEIITDILSRLPVKSLFRFKCVSPSWKSLISDPYFAKTHLGRTKTTNYPEQKIVTISYGGNLYLVDYNDGNPTSTKLEFPTVEQHDGEKWVKVLTSCDGLVLVSRSDDSIFLLNPSTRECKKLPICPFPNPFNTSTRNPYGVGYDSSTDDYKVLMLSYGSDHYSVWGYITNLAVYSLKTNAWRRIEDSHGQNKHLFNGLKKGESGVFLDGCLHFLWNGTFGGISIIAFDLSSEIVREMPLPSSLRTCDLVLLGGSLSLVNEVTGEVWMMKEYGAKYSWTKFTMCSDPSGDSLFDVLWMIAEDEVLLLEDACVERRLIVYNPYKFTVRGIHRTPSNFRFWGTCVETLISPFYV